MKAYIIASIISGIWLVVVYVFLSDYYWYQLIAVKTWGFLIVNAITLFPILLCMYIADRLQPSMKQGQPQ
ncbi:hypothetical protein [Paenibacillus sp. PL91]|uniref:hypothetical protein n=1 Tax=Paenibacillus sp. PL91 TaxID=2729538 RepID=UPI00145C729D|nr:hypothetical protein [Paenibacillus sp. PL91]MBC9202055.1 hypothetical protein [Paenibacillus sp. PL91]